MRLEVEVTFEAAHKLTEGVPLNSPCRRLHGHSYRVIVVLEGSMPDDGILIDSDGVAKIISSKFDHQYLNEVPELNGCNPSVENVAWAIRGLIDGMDSSKARAHYISVQEGFNGAKATLGAGAL